MKRIFLAALGLINNVFACTTSACVFANSNLRFGNGHQTSINSQGLFVQPFYFSNITQNWYQLTYSNYPLDTAIGTGNTSAHWSKTSIIDLYSVTPSNTITDYSQYIPVSTTETATIGYGKITTYRTFHINNQNVEIKNVFSLGQTENFVKTVTTFKNVDTVDIQNVYIWIGTRDDYVGTTDVNTKTRGNIVNGNFTGITSVSDESRAIMITNPTEGILFYSETIGVTTAYALCCQFANAYNTNPSTLAPYTPVATDGSYAIVLRLGDLQPNVSSSITWYYAAGSISSLNSVVESVAIAQIADSSPVPTPTQTTTPSVTLEPNTSIVIKPFPSFYTRTPLPTQPSKNTDNYGSIGIVLGTVAGTGTLTLLTLQIIRNIRKPNDRQRRDSVDSSNTDNTQASSTVTHLSTITEETERPSIQSNSPTSDSDVSEASKEVIEIVKEITPKQRREQSEFSLIKVNKDELGDVMNILRQRNKFAIIYKTN